MKSYGESIPRLSLYAPISVVVLDSVVVETTAVVGGMVVATFVVVPAYAMLK